MPAPRARLVILSAAERHRLEKLACSRAAGCQQVIRARIVLDAARGHSSAEISRRPGVVAGTVRLWRGRHAGEGMAGLADRRRSGRPPRFTPVQAAEVRALACQLPAVREHAQGPGVRLPEVPESQEPEAGREVPHGRPCSIGQAPVEVRTPQRDPDVPASWKHSAELPLERLRNAESGSRDPGELGPVAVQAATRGLNHAT